MSTYSITKILVAFTLSALAIPSWAEGGSAIDPASTDQSGPPEMTGFHLRIGGGALILPDYLGSKTYRTQPLPYISATYGDDVALSYIDGLTYNAVRLGGLTAGPVARVRIGQNESDNRRVLRGLGNVGTSLEVGGFVNYESGPFSARLVIAQDVASGNKGLIAELGAQYTVNVLETAAGPWMLSAGPSLSIVDSRYNRSYFGINEQQSFRSGRPLYRPGGGLESVGFSAQLVAPITRKIAVTALFGDDRLLSDAARSPIVRGGVGAANQLLGGVFLTYQLF